MDNNSNAPSIQELVRMAGTPEGRQLLALLKSRNSRELSQLMAAAGRGDQARVKSILAELLQDPQVRSLLEQMGGL